MISVLPRNWNCDATLRYSNPLFIVCAPLVHVIVSMNEMERGSKSDPTVEAALVARIKSPLRAMPVVPRASTEDDVTVPESDTPAGS